MRHLTTDSGHSDGVYSGLFNRTIKLDLYCAIKGNEKNFSTKISADTHRSEVLEVAGWAETGQLCNVKSRPLRKGSYVCGGVDFVVCWKYIRSIA